ncbi:hypothetical protein [Metabacillus sp. RGM 3146]|uniref:hypothetical protein n=1 Tax=Metabacillus sp. RGM 3146 TaxID=3401092 RepID=UPI003B99D7E5
MIIKPRNIPLHIQQLEALLRRLPESHPKRSFIQEDYLKNMAGYRGEQSVDYYFTYLDKDKYYILHDLRLSDDTHFF